MTGHLLDALGIVCLCLMGVCGSGALYLFRLPDPGRHLKPRRANGPSAPDGGAGPEAPPEGPAPAHDEPDEDRPVTWDEIRAQWDESRERHPELGLLPLRACCPTADDETHALRCEEATPADWAAIRAGMSPDPAPVPFVGWQVPDDWQPNSDAYLPGGRGLMRVGHPPWVTAAQPAISALDPARPFAGLALGPDGCEET